MNKLAFDLIREAFFYAAELRYHASERWNEQGPFEKESEAEKSLRSEFESRVESLRDLPGGESPLLGMPFVEHVPLEDILYEGHILAANVAGPNTFLISYGDYQDECDLRIVPGETLMQFRFGANEAFLVHEHQEWVREKEYECRERRKQGLGWDVRGVGLKWVLTFKDRAGAWRERPVPVTHAKNEQTARAWAEQWYAKEERRSAGRGGAAGGAGVEEEELIH